MKKIKLLFILVFVGMITSNSSAQNFNELLRASASDVTSAAKFGNAVAISGNRAIVGAFQMGATGANAAGAAYIFELNAGVWTETQKITASDFAASDYFGYSVGISGDKVIVGAYSNDDAGSSSGSAYIFDLSGGVWSETQKLVASDAVGFDYFGYSVSISGDKAIIGSYGDDDGATSSGSAYIFELSGGTWSQTHKLHASDAATNDNFGKSVAIDGNRAVIGGLLNDDGGSASGSAYIFDFSGGMWSETQKLLASDAAASDNFGAQVAISGSRVLIGAENNSNGGTAYIFDLNGGVWSETQLLVASDIATGDKFGNSLSLSGDMAVIGSYNDDDAGSSSGSAYIFELSGGTWSETQKLTASDAAGFAYFGSSAAIDGGNVVIGATGSKIVNSNEGAAYFFKGCLVIEGTDVVTSCDSLVWIDGLTYYANNNTATFNLTGQAANGCDSLVTLDLTIINSATGTDVHTSCDSLVWIDGITYYTSNNTATYNYANLAANGCDSLVTLDLTIINAVTGTDVQISCDPFVWIDGVTYYTNNNTATHNLFGQAANGCDSLVTLDLTIINAITGTDIITSCDSLIWIDGITYYANNNTATFNLANQAANGCDSLVTLDLTIINSTTGTDLITSCDSLVWIDGITYYANNNTATFNLAGQATNGCDSLVTLDLTIINSTTGTDVITSCDSLVWIDGITYYANNNTATFNLTGQAANGCDSLVSLDLTIINSTTGTDVITSCDSLVWIDGNTYYSNNSTATYNLVAQAANGCDSLVSLDLTIINSTTGTDVQTACVSYTWMDGITYYANNSTATFNLAGQAANGCDSIVTLELTINSVDINVIESESTLSSTASAATFQWLDCNENYSIILGQTGQNFIAQENGDYAVEITQNGCVDTTACYTVSSVGIDENEMLFNNVSIFPNPVSGNNQITINLGELKGASINVLNMNGQVIYSTENIQSSTFVFNLKEDAGMYFVEINSQDIKRQYKLIKM